MDVQYPWEDIPRRYHEHKMHIAAFSMDKYPVTNADFKKFVDATHYHPADDLNFLKDWKDGNYPQGWADKPVTWVSLEDARAYAKWSGKRLPHEWEWQYAAQGNDGRIYPWGNDWDAKPRSRCRSRANHARARKRECSPNRRQSIRSDGHGGQRLAVDR